MEEPQPTPIERVAHAITAAAERFVPDAFVFALIGTVLVLLAAVGFTPAGPVQVLELWGGAFWGLLPFTGQMCMVVITGYVLATSPPVHAAITRLASVPSTPQGAVAFVAFLAMTSSWLNWGFSLMFSAMLALEVARRVPAADYRALAAASFLGLGSIWAQGLSGSAALQMATPTALPEDIRAIVAQGDVVPGGILPLTHTIFLWQSLLSVVIEVVVVTLVVWLAAPRGTRARNAEALGITLPSPPSDAAMPHGNSVGEVLEHSPVLSWAFVAIAGAYLARTFWTAADPLGAITLNTLNLGFLTLGVLLHGTPARLMRAVKDATPAVWGILLQFPFYAGMAAVISKTGLNESIAHLFTSISTPATFPALIATYSAALGVFVPSGGSKWVIEAPYVMAAAHEMKVHLGWVVACYDLGEAVANLVQPFWMLPILGIFQLRARDVMGATFLVFLVLSPLVLVLVTVLGATLHYP
ncbi:MAG: short-chain fatty acid transporter [Alphaproteobacteria bacterium]|nr:short-chain fatty acid transporter [Alphaproteobacteria bacterium]